MLAFVATTWAQDVASSDKTEGKVVYEVVQKLDIKLDGDAAAFAHALPKERRSKKELLYTGENSLYQKLENDESAEDMAMQHGGMAVQIKMMEPDDKLFADLNKKITIEKKEFMTREFLISGNIDPTGWKMTGEQKMILDYPCQKATKSVEEDKEIAVWFTPAIPVSSGPEEYLGLPGLVLAVEQDGGDQTITATSIEFVAHAKDAITKPKKGKKVSRDEFKQIVDEKMKEMGAEHGQSTGTFIMHIER